MQNNLSRTWAAGLLLAVLSLGGAGVGAQVVEVPDTYVIPTSAADTSSPGFIWRMSQVESVGSFVQNSAARAEAQLAGELGDNVADPLASGIAIEPAAVPEPLSAPLEFVIPTVINVDAGGGSSGNFTPDDQMPGSPGSTGTANQAAEVLTWLDLPAGTVTMGVNSDDGFRLTIGGGNPSDKISAVEVGEYEGGRGADDSIFTFNVETAGLYAARLLWYNGGGDSRVEWFSVTADGTKLLINDTAAGAIKAYRAVTAASLAYISSVSPAPNATGVQPDAPVTAQIQDGANPIDADSISLSIDGQTVPAEITKSGSITTVTYRPEPVFASLSTHTAAVTFTDGTPKTGEWQFTIAYVATVPASLKVTADTTEPGFIFRVAQVGVISGWRNPITGSTDVNSNERTDIHLGGLLTDDVGGAAPNEADPNVQGPAIAPASAPNPAHAAITFEIPTVINLNAVGGSSSGNFPNDDQMPGAPGLSGLSDNMAAEILTYLDLPAGMITMGVNSDDGFRLQAGTDVLSAVFLGEYNGGRGAADSTFTFIVQEAGIYPFRLTWENGTGDSSVEWFTVQGDTKTLVNSTAAGAVKAYRSLSGSAPARVLAVTPLPGIRALNRESRSLTVVIADGDSPVDVSSVTLSVDGQSVTPTVTREGDTVRVVYTPANLQIPGNLHTATLSFSDASGAQTREWQFRNLKNIVLPAPVVTENFDSTEEGSVPTGWVELNFTDCSSDFCDTPGFDLDSLHSDNYKGFVVVARDRLEGLKGRIFANVAPGQTVNGEPVVAVGAGNVLYAESDVRDGNQVQFITTRAFDLSNVTNTVLTFDSIYEQNQDNIAAVEYSVDGGTNWLPVVYFIDSVDGGGDFKLNADGTVDAVRTLNEPNPDTANWTDPVTQEAKGDTYGAFIAAPITDALAPFIVARVNDDQIDSKRVEIFRLWEADGKADVRLRFAHGGTASWYFGVDNIAFYDAPAPGTAPDGDGGTPGGAPTLSFARSATGLTLTFTGALQSADNVAGPYTDVPGAQSPFDAPTTGAGKFYRTRQVEQ